MRDFFKSPRAKILLAVLVVLFAFLLNATRSGGISTLLSQVMGAISAPFQKLASSFSGAAIGALDQYIHINDILAENEALREENQQLKEQLVDFEKYKSENEQYRNFPDVTDESIQFEPASVIGRDINNRFHAFTIDKGSLVGVEVGDPVITKEGLVGKIYEVGATYSKVRTILDVTTNVGVYDSARMDTGILTGDVQLAGEGQCKMTYIPRDSTAAAGDLIVTSGVAGVYPEGLIVGSILEIHPESDGTSLYAVVQPAADIRTIKNVFVITDFAGQTHE